jgi:histone deacetylase 1/2
MPSILQLKSPYLLLYGSIPILTHLKVFGCACFPLLKPYNTHKLQPKTSTCIFLGYAGQYKGYVCFSLRNHKCFVTLHVIFDESVFLYISEPSASSPSPSHASTLVPPSISLHNAVLPACSTSSSTMSHAVSLDALSSPIISSPLSGLDSATQFSPPQDPDFHPENLCVVLPLSPMNIHPMTTRSKNGISKRKAYSTTVQSVDFSPVELSTFKIASQHAAWRSAMQEEINALHAQGTWDLVPLPHAKNLVGCK